MNTTLADAGNRTTIWPTRYRFAMLAVMPNQSDGSRLERRRQRSSDALTALTRLFEAARVREGLSAVALADEAGILVAGAGHFAQCELLAAEAPLKTTTRKRGVEEIWVDGVRVLLSAEPGKRRVFSSLAEGCQRILGKKSLMVSAFAHG